MTRFHLFHTDLVFYVFTVRKSITYAKDIFEGFAKRHCGSLEDRDIAIYVISNQEDFLTLKARPNH